MQTHYDKWMSIKKFVYFDSSSCVSCGYISLGNYLFHPNRQLYKKLKSSWWFFEWSLLLFPWYFASTVFGFLLSLLDYLMVYVFYYLQTLILNSWGCFHFGSQWKPYEWESVFPSWKRLAWVPGDIGLALERVVRMQLVDGTHEKVWENPGQMDRLSDAQPNRWQLAATSCKVTINTALNKISLFFFFLKHI